MRKHWLLFIFVLLFIPKIIYAEDITLKVAESNIYDLMANSVKNNKWQVTTEGEFYNIEVDVGNVSKDSNLKSVVDKLKKLKNYSVQLIGCKDANRCDENNLDYIIDFSLKEDGNRIYLSTSYVEDDDYRMRGVEKLISIAYRKGKKTKIIEYKDGDTKINKDTSGLSKLEGSFAKPQKIGNEGTIVIPEKDDDFWKNTDKDSGLNCYYFVFNYTSSSKNTVLYNIKNREDVHKYIYLIGDAYKLASHPVEDLSPSVFQVSNDREYAVCFEEDDEKVYGKTFTFKYSSDDKLKALNGAAAIEAARQNGQDNVRDATKEEIEAAAKAVVQNWSPQTLCGNNNEYCSIDITKFCTTATVARTLKFLGLLLSLAKVLVPAIIIILGFIDLGKIMLSGNADDAKKQGKNIIKRVVIGMVIFLSPTILSTIYNVAYNIANDEEGPVSAELNVPENFKNCVNCVLNADSSCIIKEE